jgi:PAS domain S-box-containing protein
MLIKNLEVLPATILYMNRTADTPAANVKTHVEERETAAPDTRGAVETGALERLFFKVASDAVVISDEDGTIVQLNAQTETLFGYRREELLNRSIETLVPERLRARHIALRRAYFRDPQPRPMGHAIGLFGLRSNGTEFPIDIALSPMMSESRHFVAAAIRDVTRQWQLERELRLRARELEQADRHRDQFLITLAHELANPIAAVAYSAALVQRSDVAAADRERAARNVLAQANFMRQLVRDLGELSRVRRGEIAVRTAPLDLADVARLAVEISRPLIERHGHALEVAMPMAAVAARGDAARLVQIVTNLLNNAARYTPTGGRIRLSVAEEDSTAVLRVKDNGIGIPRQMLTRVFDPFVRLGPARQRYAGGMGIGLSFARHILELQGGRMEAFSEGEGQGSEFVMRMPRAQASR